MIKCILFKKIIIIGTYSNFKTSKIVFTLLKCLVKYIGRCINCHHIAGRIGIQVRLITLPPQDRNLSLPPVESDLYHSLFLDFSLYLCYNYNNNYIITLVKKKKIEWQ